MKIVIVGGVAAGTKAAAKIKREIPDADVHIYTRSKDISYAGCGLPYYIGGVISSRDELIVNTPQKFMSLTRTTVHTESEVTAIDPAAKQVTVNGEAVAYDKLILAVGAAPILPAVEGAALSGVFTVRTPDDAIALREYAEKNSVKKAVVVGAGFIGLEVSENLARRGIEVTVLDMASQILPGVFDADIADYLKRSLIAGGLRVQTGVALSAIKGEEKVTGVETANGLIPAEMVVLSLGIRPATAFLKDSGIEMEKGLIITDEHQKTNIEDIYAVGDCAMIKNRLTGKKQWSAMGSTANIAGRCLAVGMNGAGYAYQGCLGTAIIRLSDTLNAAKTGLTEAEAAAAGIEYETVLSLHDDKAHYYPDSSSFIIKLIAEKGTGKLLGAQIVGSGEVDKAADVAVVGLSFGATVYDYLTMDFSYAPPFSTAIHPFSAACGVMTNKLEGKFETVTPLEYAAGKASDCRLIDMMPAPTIAGAEWLNLADIETGAQKFAKDEKLLLVCNRGRRAYLAQNRLRAIGYTNTKVLEGGASFNVIKRPRLAGGKLSAEEIKRVKGLGCLQDKRYDDVFNVRVITGNGKITAAQNRAVVEAAERFGSGEIAMTTRLTLEIQGVKYDNIDPLIAFLGEHGLEIGGTGSRVRPVVSCKGTTCQYGLCDTYKLSAIIHERFYKGYHSVTLPHKFKIAVGGCPNNCVKPDLNDLGIIGQRVPIFDFGKCRGCKKCFVEASCPIHVASFKDGKLNVDMNACNHCGRCKNKCPFGVTEEYVTGYKVYIGGRWGKSVAHGIPLEKIFTSDEEVLDIVERAILFFRNEGLTGERFADTVNRLGFDYVQDKLLNGEISKDAILEKTVKGGASC